MDLYSNKNCLIVSSLWRWNMSPRKLVGSCHLPEAFKRNGGTLVKIN